MLALRGVVARASFHPNGCLAEVEFSAVSPAGAPEKQRPAPDPPHISGARRALAVLHGGREAMEEEE